MNFGPIAIFFFQMTQFPHIPSRPPDSQTDILFKCESHIYNLIFRLNPKVSEKLQRT